MSYIALYRKWRPLTFDDVVEQSNVVSILKNAVKQGRIGHAYLFCGTRGTGKTTIAKIFSRAINCIDSQDGNPCNQCEVCKGILEQSLLDVIEIDAASNTGVDNIRDIIEEIAYVPVRARYKVYIIDEVHMLSNGAFNALLKTLEEPPAHAVFILATTDPQKLPATILSRCQRFEFRRITPDNIVGRLKLICDSADKEAEEDALYYIAQAADGALRDAISILDQCISVGNNKMTLQDVLDILGVASERLLAGTAEAVVQKDVDKVLVSVDQMIKEGKEISEFVSGLIVFFRNMLIQKATGGDAYITNVTPQTLDELKNISASASTEQIIGYIKELSTLERDLKWTTQKKIILEVGLIKLCTMQEERTIPATKAVSSNSQSRNSGQKGKENPVQGTGTDPFMSNKLSNTEIDGDKKNTDNAQTVRNTPDRPTGLMLKLRPVEMENLKEIFLDLKEAKHMMIMSYLRNVRALYYSESIVYLVFCGAGKEIKKDAMAKPENMKIISEAFSKVVDGGCTVKLFTEDELSEDSQSVTDHPADSNDVINRLSNLANSGVEVEFE